MSYTDINEAIVAGHTLDDLIAIATPMITDDHSAAVGLARIENALKDVERAEPTARSAIVTRLFKQMKPLVAAWISNEQEMTQIQFQLRSHRGAGATVDALFRNIRKLSKQEKKNKARKEKITALKQKIEPKPFGKDEPDPDVAELLERKPIRESGEFIGWGEPYPKIHNLDTILRHDPRIKGRLRYNEFANRSELDGEPLIDYNVDQIRMWISKTYYGLDLKNQDTGRIMHLIARENSFHPIKKMLEDLPPWDGIRRAEYLLCDYLGCEDTKLHRAYSRNLLLHPVARVYEPGCKVDYMAIMYGATGKFKSSCLRVLVMDDEYFADSKFDLASKDAYLNIQGVWLYELSDGEDILNSAGHSRAKNFVSSSTDRYRAPYHRYTESVPRQGVMWMTTNCRQLSFLSDPTSSRRYWAFEIGDIQIGDLKRDVQQIWAEVLHMYHTERGKGTLKYWLTPDLEEQRKQQNRMFAESDPWAEVFLNYLKTKARLSAQPGRIVEFTIRDLLHRGVGFRSSDINLKNSRRAADILMRMGCTRGPQKRIGKTRVTTWTWKLPENIEDDR